MARKRGSIITERAPASAHSPLIFISHDSRDAALAEAFETLLTDASGGILKAFRSSDRKGTSGIEFGADWYPTIMTTLERATDVVALLTPRSVERPWILYEVGVARGMLGKPAFGVAFGLRLATISGPFAQFQNSEDDEDSLTKLVLQLIRRNPEASPREEAVRRQVAAFRATVNAFQSVAPKQETSSEAGLATIAKLFEEVKVMFAELPEMLSTRLRIASTGASPFVVSPVTFDTVHALRDAVLENTSEDPAHDWTEMLGYAKTVLPNIPDGALEIAAGLQNNEGEQVGRGLQALVSYRRLHFGDQVPKDPVARETDHLLWDMIETAQHLAARHPMKPKRRRRSGGGPRTPTST